MTHNRRATWWPQRMPQGVDAIGVAFLATGTSVTWLSVGRISVMLLGFFFSIENYLGVIL